MPYESKKTGKNEITVSKKGGGVVGHTTPDKYKAYMAALHIHSGDNAAQGGVVESDEKKQFPPFHPQDLRRSVHGDVSVYKRNYNPAPGVYMKKMAETIVPKDSEIDQSIGSTNKVVQEERPRYMAQGGFVEPDEEEMRLKNSLTPGTSVQAPPTQAAPTPTPIMPKMPPQQVTPAAAPPIPQRTPAPQLPGMPQGTTVDQIAPYFSQMRQRVNQYGPQAQMDLQRQTMADRNSFGNRLTSGLKGFGDAIMMGVARAGNPGWQQAYEAQQDERAREQMGTLQKAGETNLQQTEADMKVDMMNPSSQLSEITRNTYAPLFEKLGYPPEALKNMSAANIESAMNLMSQYGGMEKQALIKEYELAIERAKMAQLAGKQASEQELAQGKAQADAASEILKRSKNMRILGIPIPFTSDVSGKEEKEAQKVLLDQMRHGTSTSVVPSPSIQEQTQNIVDVKTTEEAEALPPGTRFKLNGRTGTVK